MRCPTCGAKLSKKQAQCPSCGTPTGPQAAYFGGAARSVRSAWGLPVSDAAPSPKNPVSGYLVFAIVALVLIAAMLAALYSLQHSSTPMSGVAIDEATFPDPVLRAAVEALDADGDRRLSDDESSACTSLDVSSSGLADLSGVRYLRALVDLDAHGNELVSADLSGMARLRSVNISGNAVQSFSTAGIPSLDELDVSDNGMTALDVSSSDRLRSLSCSGNDIARLDLGRNHELVKLACDPEQNVVVPLAEGFFPDESLRGALAEFDADGDGALTRRERTSVTSIRVNGSALKNLYGLSWFDALDLLDVSDSHIEFLDGSLLGSSIASIVARDCDIEGVDLSPCGLLVALDLAGNVGLEQVDLSSNTHLTSLDLSGCGLVGTLDLTPCAGLASVDVSGNPRLENVLISNGAILDQKGAFKADEGCRVSVAGA